MTPLTEAHRVYQGESCLYEFPAQVSADKAVRDAGKFPAQVSADKAVRDAGKFPAQVSADKAVRDAGKSSESSAIDGC